MAADGHAGHHAGCRRGCTKRHESAACDKEHAWYWRRRRNQGFGYWECVRCGLKTDPVGLDETGGPELTPEEALER